MRILLLLVMLLTAGCGGGNSGEPQQPANRGKGWVKIEQPSDQSTIIVDSYYTVTLSGSAFVSPNFSYCNITNDKLSCDPGITVNVITSSYTIQANVFPEYCWLFQYYLCGASWNVSIPLSLGINNITVRAHDSGGNYGTDTIAITLVDTKLPVVKSISPSDGSINISRDASVNINFSEAIDISSITPSRIYLIDQSGNTVTSTLNVTPTTAVLVPGNLLDYSNQYTVKVEPGLVDLAGNSSNQLFTSTFAINNRPWNTPVVNNFNGSRHHHTSIRSDNNLILWGGYFTNPDISLRQSTTNSGTRFNPSTNTFTTTSAISAPISRALHSAIWTGSEMIIWGGYHGTYIGTYEESLENSGGRYDPVTDSWQSTSLINAPEARHSHTAIWTGTEMIIWGGTDLSLNKFNTGARYNPTTNTWTAISTTNAPTGRIEHSATWTGTEMIIWGGRDSSGPTNNGARYNPTTDSWSSINLTGAPEARGTHTAIWTGTELIIWGKSQYTSSYTAAGGRYNPTTDTWSSLSSTNSPLGREEHTATWNGTAMMIWGGFRMEDLYNSYLGIYRKSKQYLNDLTYYYPASDSWQLIPTANTPAGRYAHTANFVGNSFIICNGNEDATPDDPFTNDGRVTNSCVILPGD